MDHTHDEHRVERSSFSSRNADETTEYLRQMYIDNRTSFSDVAADSSFHAHLAGLGAMRADRVTGDLTLDLHGEPLDYALFGQVRHGTWDLGTGNDRVLFGPDDCLIYPLGTDFDLHAHHFDISVVTIPGERLAAIAAGFGATAGDDPLTFHAMTPVSPAAAHHFAATLRLVHATLHDDDDVTATHPLVTAELLHAMGTAVLTTFPNSVMTAPTPTARRVPASLVRRVIDHIDDHAHEPLTISDIATALDIDTPTLRRAVDQHCGMTPTAYRRRVRLHHAHRDLISDDRTPVAEIARRWGYHDHRHFTAAYTQLFHRPPRPTCSG